MAALKDLMAEQARQAEEKKPRNGQKPPFVQDPDTGTYRQKKSGWTVAKVCKSCGGTTCLMLGSWIACRNKHSAAPSMDITRNTTGGLFHIHVPYDPSGRGTGQPHELPGEIPELKLDVVCMNDVESKDVEWYWPGRIPLRMNTLFVGQPGVGKTFATLFLASAASRGDYWPDGAGPAPKGKTIILSSEDTLEYTIKPRLDAMCADSTQILYVRGVNETDDKGKKIERSVRLDLDMRQLEALLQTHPDVVLIIIDPVSEYLGKTDSHKNAEVRSVVAPLAALAEKYGVAIVNVTHFNKSSGGQAMYKAMGSLAFVAQARAAWAFIPDSENQDRVLFLPLKMNIAKRPPGLAYQIENGVLRWQDGDVDTSPDDAMNALSQPKKSGDALSTAMAWLKQRLADGQPVESEALRIEAEQAGISFITLKRAKSELKADGLRASKGRGADCGKWFVRWTGETLDPHEIVDPVDPLEPLTQEDQEAQPSQEAQEDQEDHPSLSDDWTDICRRQ